MVFGVVCGVGRGSLGGWEDWGSFGGFVGWVGVLGVRRLGGDGWMDGWRWSFTNVFFNVADHFLLILDFISSISLSSGFFNPR
jgi:hypothetical protein